MIGTLTRAALFTAAVALVAVPFGPVDSRPAGPGLAAVATASASSGADRPAVIGTRVIGKSVRQRPITAWRLGTPGAPRAVVFASMHGDEAAPSQILRALRDGPRIRGVDLWVVPRQNPDGAVRHSRKNARGVDLNRNFPRRWIDLDGRYESGRGPASEPETRAAMRFLSDIRPRWVVGFHQPLNGVDTDTKRPAFASRLARHLNLPRKRFDCGGVCHGTMTMWFNHRFPGAAVTVEYGSSPGRHRMRVKAPDQLVRALGGRR